MLASEIAAGFGSASRRRSRISPTVAPREVHGWFAAAAFLVATCWSTSKAVDHPVALALAVAGLVAVGLPHGQFDWRMAQARLRPQLGPASAPVFFSVYLGLAGLMLVVWLVSPLFGFCAFLALSVLHFGLEDLQAGLGADPFPAPVTLALRGSVPFVAPALLHGQAMAQWFAAITGVRIWEVATRVHSGMSLVGPAWVVGSAGLLAVYAGRGRWAEAAEYGCAALALALLPIPQGFLLWFIIGHSPRHLVLVFQAEPPERRRTWFFRQLLLGAFVSALLLGALAIAAGRLASPLWAIRVAVAGLAALTLPHLLTCAFLQPAGMRARGQRPAFFVGYSGLATVKLRKRGDP